MIGPSVSYVVESLPWAVAGFIAGCMATLYIRPSASAHQERSMTPTEKPRRRFTLVHFIGLLVVALTIMSAVQVWVQSQERERLTRCLVTYANSIADAIDVRSRASTEAQRATVEMWRTVFQQPQTDEGRAAARRVFEAYLTKQAEAVKAQQDNPYPSPPRVVCPDTAR